MAGNNGGPWGGGPGRGDDDDEGRRGGQRPGGDGPQIPEIDEIMKKGQERLRVLMGGRGNVPNAPTGPQDGFEFGRGTVALVLILLFVAWLLKSFYIVKAEERSVKLFLGEFNGVGGPGLNFAPWPLATYNVIPVTKENLEDIGVSSGNRGDSGLMLTTDENIVDVDFQVVWNIKDPQQYLFNIREPRATVRAVSEAAMREVIAESELDPILNTSRDENADKVMISIQEVLDSYESGINIVRVNLQRADPPKEVIDAFRQVQAAALERERLENQADAYANTVLGGARGEAAQILELAEAYRARVVNEAEGEAKRFEAVLGEYKNAPEVTRKRLYLETIEQVLGDVNKIMLDPSLSGGNGGGQGVVPYLPLNEIVPRGGSTQGGN